MRTADFLRAIEKCGKRIKDLTLWFTFLALPLSSLAQPTWFPATPSSPSTGPLSITIDYGINMAGIVYICVVNYDYTDPETAASIKSAALAGPLSSRVATAVLTVDNAHKNMPLQVTLDVPDPNRIHTVLMVAEGTPGGLQADEIRFNATTLVCPSIYVETGFNNTDRCVNGGGADKIYTLHTYNGYDGKYSNILKGASWRISWGDGLPATDYTYTSTYDNDGPGGVLLPGWESLGVPHAYTVHDSCYRRAVLTIKNPGACASIGAQTERKDVLLAGRDVDIDGNGYQLLVNDADDSPDTIKVCEGTTAFITLRDNGEWDCDYNFKTYPPGEPNSNARNAQYVYGMHPVTQAVENTITGNVLITGTYPGTANTAAGHASGIYTLNPSPVENPQQTSDLITIPNTAIFGQYMHVYFKNWNKCNPYIGAASIWNGSAVWDSIVIYIIDAPPAPTAPDRVICLGDSPILTVTSPPVGGVFKWYKNADKSGYLASGVSFDPSADDPAYVAPGTNTYYVADGQLTGFLCEGPVEPVVLTVNPLPTITSSGTMSAVCFSGVAQSTSLVYTATTNSPNFYRIDWTTGGISDQGWTAFAFAGGGGTINTIAVSAGATSGVKSGTLYIRNANGCINSQAVTLTINPLPTITTGGTMGQVCFNAAAQTTTLVYTATGNSPTEYMVDWTTAGITDQGWTAYAFAGGGGTINTIAVSAGATTGTKTGTLYIRNANGCVNSQAVTLTINPLPTITTTGNIAAVCYSGSSQTTSLVYTATSNTPVEYMIDWTSAGITDQAWTTFAFAGGGGTINNIAISAGATSGTKNGTMTIRTAAGCTASQAVTVTINPLPTITTTGTMTAVCYNAGAQTTSLAYTATGNSPTEYMVDWTSAGITDQAWTGFAFAAGGGTINTIAVSAGATSGNKSGTLYIRNANGCVNSQAVTLTINPLPTITTGGTMGGVCYNTAVQSTTLNYSATANNPNFYRVDWTTAGIVDQGWTAFAFAAGGGTINTITVSAGATTGTKNGTMYISNANGCINTQAVTLVISPNPTIATTGTINDICYSAGAQTGNLVYTATTDSPTQYMIDWTTAGITDQGWTAFGFAVGGGTINNIAVSASATAGTKNGTMTIRTAAGCTATQAVSVTINPLPTITTAGAMTAVCYNAGAQTTSLAYTATGNSPTEYMVDWTSAGITDQAWTGFAFAAGGGTINTIAVSAGATSGAKSGTLYIRNANGCVNSQAVTLTINPLPTITTGGSMGGVCFNAAAQTTTLVYTATGNSPNEYMVDWSTAGITDQGWTAFAFAGGGGTINTIAVSAGATTGTKNGTLYIRNANGCINSQAVTLVISPIPTITTTGTMAQRCFSTGAQTTTLAYTASSNSPAEYMIDWTTAGINDQTWTPFAFVVGGGTINNIAISAGATDGVKSGTMTIRTAAGCVATQAVSLTINPLPTPSISGLTSVCAGQTGVLYNTPVAGGRTYAWTVVGGSVTAGGGTREITVTWGAAGAGTVSLIETISATGCAVTTPNYNVTINPGPPAAAPTFTSGATEICKEGTLNINVSDVATASSYEWDHSWLAPLVDATTATSDNAISLAGLAKGTYTVRARGTNGCGPGPWMAVHTFDINDIPDLTAASANPCSDGTTGITFGIDNTDLTYCTALNYNITAINNGGLTASAGSPAVANGLAANVIADDAWTNTTGADVNVVYTVVPVSAQGCTGLAETVTVTVKSEPKGWNATATTCSDVALNYNIQTANINVAPGNSQASTFTWQAAANPNVTGETTALQSTGVINDNLNNVTGVDQTVVYTVTPTGVNGCAGNSFTVTVTVKSEPLGWNATASTCSDVAVGYNLQTSNINVVPGNSQASTFSWVATANPLVTGESTTAQSGNTITDVINNVTGSDQTVIYTVTPTGTNLCAGNSFTVTVTVKSEPTGGAGTTSTCSDVALNYNLQTANVNVLGNSQASTFSWVAAANPNVTGESTTAQSGGSIIDNINNVSGVDQTVTYTVTPTGTNLCVGNSFTVTATIKSEPKGTNATISTCSDVALNYNIQTANINVAPGNSQASTFTWQAAANPNVTGETTALQSTGVINDNLNNVSGVDQTVIYTVTPTGTNLCAGNSFTVTVTVKSEPVGANSVTSTCSDVAVGYNLQTTNINGLGNSQASTFSWIATPNGSVTGESTVAQSGNTITDVINNVTGGDQVVVYTVTPTGTNGCAGNSFTMQVTVKSEPTGGAGTTSTCSDVALNYNLQTANVNVLGNSQASTFSWVAAANPNVTGESTTAQSGGSITDNINNVSGVDQTVTYTVTPTGTNLCVGNSFTVTATIKSEPKGTNATISTCSDVALNYNIQTANINVAPGNSQASTFTWQAAANPNVTGETTALQSTGVINDNLNNVSGVDQTVIYTVTPTGTNLCAGNSFTVTVTVKSEPLGWNATASTCSDVAVGYNLQTSNINVVPGNSQASTFSWVAAANPNVTGESTTAQSGNTITDVINNVTGSDQTVIYTVTPTGTNLCAGNSFTVTVTVKSEPTGGAGTTNSCSDVALAYNLQTANVNVLGNSQASTFSWVAAANPNVTGESTTAQAGGSIIDNINNISGSDQTVIYTVTPTGTNLCVGNNFTVTATIKSEPRGANATATTCSDVALNYNLQTANINTVGNSQASNFSWVAAANPNVTGESTTAQATGIINDNLNNITSVNQVVVYTITPTGTNGCTGDPFTYTVTVKPEPVITAGQNPGACSGNALNYKILMDNFTNPADNVTFTWAMPVLAPVDPGFTGGSARLVSSAANITDTYTNTTGLIGTATYTVTPVYNGCAGNPVTVVVTVGSEPVLDPGLNRFACSAEATGLILQKATGSVDPTYYSVVLQAIDAGLTPNYGANTLPKADAPSNYLATHIFTNTTTSNKTVTYRVTPILAPDCIGDPVDVVVTVRPPIVAGSITGNTAICYNTDAPNIPNAVVASGGDGVITYAWYYTENLAAIPGDINWTLIPGETASSYNPGVLVNPTKYIRKASDGSCTAVAYSNMIQIDINPLPVTGAIAGDATLCESATNKVYQVPNTPGSTYTWTVPASLTRTSPQGLYFIIVDANGASLPGEKITVTETFTSTTGCVGLPVEKFVTVVATIPGEVVAGPASVCQGATGVVYSVTDNPGSTYSWVVPAGATITSDPTLHQISVNFTMAGSGDVSVVETNGAVCTTVHVPKTVTINALPTVYNVTAPPAYCTGGTGVTVTLSNSQTGVNYQLKKDGLDSGAPQAGSTGSALTWTNNLVGSYTVVATNATTSCTQAMNGTAVVTINNIAPGSIGTDHAICEGAGANPLTNTTSATGGGTITYQWQSSLDNFATAPTNIVGATSAVYTPGTLTQDTYFRRVAYSTMGSSVCSDFSNTVLVTVINFVPGSITADQTICENDTPAAFGSVTPTGDGVFTYKWQNSTDGITYADIAGETNETYTPSAGIAVDTWYKRIVTSTVAGVPCTEETNAVKVTVINFTPGSIATDQTICYNTAPAAFTSVAPSGDGTKTFQWESSIDNFATAPTVIAGANSATYTAGALTVNTWFRRAVTATVSGTSCTEYTNTVLVTINDFDPGIITAAQTICEGDSPAAFSSVTPSGVTGTLFTYQWQSSIDNVTYSNIPGATSETYTSGALSQDTYFRRRVTATLNGNACTEFTPEILVTINNLIPGTIIGNQTVCEAEVPAAFTETAPTGDGIFTYQWEESSDNTTWTAIVGAVAPTYAPPVALAQDMWYRRQVTSTLGANTCTEVTNTIKVTVNNFVPGSIGSDQTICESTSAAALTSVTPTGDGVFTYKWYVSTDGVGFALIGGAISETYSPGVLAADRWYKREVISTLSGKACSKETNVVKITVNNMLPGSITADQTICDGGTPVAFGSTAATGDGIITYQWMESINGVAFTNIVGATSETFTAPALTQDTWYRRSATSTTGGNACTEESNIVKVTVINFLPGSIGTDRTICNGTAPAAFTSVAPSGDGVFTYRWESSPDNATWTVIAGETGATYTSGVLAADTYFRREVTSTLNAKACVQYTNSVLVTVINFVPGSISAAQTICEGDTPAAFTSVTPTGDGAFTYQWQYSTDGGSYANIAGATAETFAPGALTVDTWYRRNVISTLNGTQCTQLTPAVKVTVNNFSPGSISAAQTICEGGNPAAFTSVTPTGDGAFTYQWQSSTDGASFADIVGETNETYDAPALTQDTWYKRLVTSTLSGNVCTEETNTVKVTVNNFDPGSITADQTICENTAPAAFGSVAPSGDGTFTYRWLSSSDGVSFAAIGGAISETYNPGLLAADTWYKREVTSTLNATSCIEETNVIKVTVNNMTPGTIAADQTICDGAVPAAFTVTVAATGDGLLTYKWYESLNGIIFTEIAGETADTYAPGALTQDTWFRRETTSTVGGQTCTEESNIVRVTVNNFLPGSIGSDQTICEGTAPAAFTSVAASGDGTKAYQWQSSPDGLAPWTDIVGATNPTYTSPALIADTYFRRKVTSTLNAIPCIQYTNTVVVTVNNFDPGSIAAAQTICEGDTPAAFTSVGATGDGTITYQWQLSTDGASFISIPGETNATYTSGALTVDTWFKRQATSTLNGMQCVEYTAAVKVTVNNFTPGSISAAQTICEGGDPAAFTAVAPTGDGTFTFQWQSSTDGVAFADIVGETAATYDAPVLTQDTWYRRIVTSTLSSVPCALSTNIVKITVNNFVPGSIDADQIICENSIPAGLTSVTPTGDGTFTYKWYSSTDGISFGVIAGAISETYNPPALAADMWYRREVTSTLLGKSCTEITNTVNITVNNMTPGSITADQTICEGVVPAALGSVTPTGDGGITYQWKQSVDGIAFTDIALATSETFAPPALTADTWYKRAATSTLGGNSCTEESNVVRITVINFLPGSVDADQTICEATAPVAFTSVPASGDGVKTYQWQNSTDGVAFANIGLATSATYTSPALTQDTWFRRLATATLNGHACTEISDTILVTVNNFDPGSISAAQTICEGDIPAAFTSVTPTGDGVFTYQWQNSTDGVSFISIPGANSETYTSTALTQDTWFRRQVTSTLNGNTCTENTASVKVTVNNFTPGSISAAQTICEGDDPAAFTAVAPAGDGTFTFKWQSSTDGVTFADIALATAATYDSPALTQDTWFKRLVTSDLGGFLCTEETNTVKVTVNNLDPGSIGSAQTICENTAPASLTSVTPSGDGTITFRWLSSTDGATFNPIAGAISETYNPPALAVDTWYRREVTSTLSGKACIEFTNDVKITVNNMLPGSITADQTICDGAVPAAFGSTAASGDGLITYQWMESINGIAFTDIVGETGELYVAPALIQDTWYKRKATSTLAGNICTEESNVIKVTVINFLPGSIGSDQTICEATIPAAFTSVAPSGDGTFTYRWESSPDNATWTVIAGATGATYTSVALAADTYFRREVTSTLNAKQCVQYTNSVLVTVNNFVPGTIASDQTICEDTAPAAFTSVTPTGDGVFTYQWQRSSDGVTFVNITGATSETYTSVALTQDTWFRREVTSTLNAMLCTEYTAAVKVTVNNFTPGSISSNQTICEGDDPAAFTAVAPAGDGTFTFQWQSSTDGVAFANIALATAATYDSPALTQDTWFKRLVTSTLGANTCTEETNTVKVTVNNFDPGSIGSDETICEGTAPSPLTSVGPSGDGAFTYRWFSSTDGVTFGTLIVGAVSETYSPGTLTADTWFRREVTSTLSGKACVENTNAVKITVNNFVPGSITADQTICEGTAPAAFGSVTPTGDVGAVFSYQWKVSTDGVAFTDIVGATLETYTSGVLSVDTWFKRAVTSTMGVNTCTEETNAVKVTVINFTPGSIIADQTICEATVPATFTGAAPSGDGTFTYQWQDSPDGLTFTDIAGATGASYTAPALSADTWFRRRVISTLNLTSCVKITNSVKVTINRVDPGTIGAAQTICEGTAPVMFSGTVPTGDGVLTYQWSSSLDGISFTNITGATSSTYTSGALVQDTWFRREVISTLNAVSCGETSPAVKVTVNNFTPGTISAAQTICDGTAPVAFTSVTPTGDGTFTYQWQSSTDNVTFTNIGGAISETYTSGALTQDTWFKRLVTSTLSGNNCTEETNTVLVTVVNFLPGSIGVDQTICENTMPVPMTSVTPTGDGSFTYRWFVSTDGVSFSVIAGAVYETYAPGSLAADRWYKREVTSTLNGRACVAETNVVHITVNNFVPGSVSTDQTICEGGTPAAFTSVTPTGDGVFTYQWRSSTDGVNFIDITGATGEVYGAGALTQDTWYKRAVISTLNGIPCTKETAAVKVTVNNVNAGTIISDQTICIGSDPVSFWSIVAGTGDGAITWQWQSSTDNVTFTDVPGATGLTYDAPAIATDTWYRRVTTSLLNAVSCTKISNVVKITVNVITGGTITSDQTICFGSTPAPFGSSDDGSGTGTVTYQWQRSSDNVIFSTIPGATSTTYAPGVLYTDTWYKRTIISIQNGVLCTSESNTVKISINPLPIAVLSGGATICPSESAILKVEMMAGTGPYELDIENHGTVTGYTSNADISVSPVATTTYKLLRVRDANGCQIVSPSANLIGTATVTVRALPAITTSPVNKVVCEFGVTTFSVAATGSDLTYQWYVDDGGGFDPVTDGGIYFGANTTTLNLFGATRDMNGYQYHAVVTGCATNVTSTDAILTVNTPAEINIQPKDSTICMGGNAAFSVTAMGTSITYKWQVNKGTGFVDVVNDANFNGAATNTLSVTAAPGTFNNYIFRVIVKGTCGVPVYSNFVVLRVYIPPTVTLNPVSKAICDGGGPVTFIGNGTGQIDSLRWQVFSGGVWSDIYDNTVYSGTTSQQLTLSNIPLALNTNQYRLGLKARCTTVYTNAATLTVNSNPVVTFASPIAACGDVPLILTPAITGGSGTNTQHLWTGDVGPLNNYFIEKPTFRSQIANSYVLNYRVKDSNGCYGNSDVTVVVDAPDAEFTQTAMNGCTPLSVTFNKDMTGYTSFAWDFGDGSAVNTTDANPVHTFINTNPASIEYRNVKLTVTSAGGCTDTFTSTVTVYPAVNATITANKLIVCSGQSISFSTAPGASKYFWEFGDGTSGYSPSESTTHLYTNFTTSPLVLTVKLTTTSFYSCTDDETITVTVMPVPIPQFVAVPPSQIFDPAGNQVVFTNQTNTGSWTYLWKFGDGGTSAASDPTHTYTKLGTYKVVLTVNNANCTDSVSHEVRILPPPPVADFDSIPSECAPMAFTINNTSQHTDVPGTSYRWDFGDGSISTAKNPTYTYFDPGTYRIELTVTGPGDISSKSQLVKVYESPKAYFEITPNLVFVNDEKVRAFNLTTPTTGLTYLWEFGDGDTAKIKEPFHKYMEEGVYDVTLWAYMVNPDGKVCSDKYVLSPAVTVEPAGQIRFSTVFTPNTSGEEVVDDLSQINSGNVDRFFFPPIREKVLDYKLQIFNRLGVLIFQSDNINKPWNGYYKGQLCPQGVYVWYVEGKYANGMPFKKVGDVTLLH